MPRAFFTFRAVIAGNAALQPQRWKDNEKAVPQEMKKIPNKRVFALLLDTWFISAVSLILFGGIGWGPWIIYIVYFLSRDALIQGRSIGKFIVGIRVIGLEGNPCDFHKSCLRNLPFIIPIISFIVNYFDFYP